jgi:hypothetical protein
LCGGGAAVGVGGALPGARAPPSALVEIFSVFCYVIYLQEFQ